MKVTISKILNKTDLAQSGSHGGLVVPRSEQDTLKLFFEAPGKEQKFFDRCDMEEFNIHYQDYTSNGTTPNDRITPIGKYASKHNLKPGDILILDKIEYAGNKEYFIEYARKFESVFFAGKSKTTVDVLNFEQLINIISKNISEGIITKVSANEYVMPVMYMGFKGILRILQNAEDYELYFDEIPISENKKYFELDTSVIPFVLKKSETWRVAISVDADKIELHREADAELIAVLAETDTFETEAVYHPMPEIKAPEKDNKSGKTPSRSRKKAENALMRAAFRCEAGVHETFLRKKSLLPYTEPHHLIPLQFDEQFEYSLDVEANIVSLCSHCHNKLHYGAGIEGLIRQLWEQRKDELNAAGLGVMKNGVKLTVDILLGFY